MQLLHVSYAEAKRLLSEHRKELDAIADYLIRKETITGKEFMKILRAAQKGIEIPENLEDLVLPEQENHEKETSRITENVSAEVAQVPEAAADTDEDVHIAEAAADTDESVHIPEAAAQDTDENTHVPETEGPNAPENVSGPTVPDTSENVSEFIEQ